jgi:hypothetical protein
MALTGKANGCWAQHVPELHRKKVMAAILADMDRNPGMDEVDAAKLSAKYFIEKYTNARQKLMEMVVAEYDKDFSSGQAVAPVAEPNRTVLEEAETAEEKEAAKKKEEVQRKAAEVAADSKAVADKAKIEKKPPKKAKPKDPEVRAGETTAESAGREWNARRPAGFPAWEELPQAARTEFASYGPPGWEQADIITTAAKFSRGGKKPQDKLHHELDPAARLRAVYAEAETLAAERNKQTPGGAGRLGALVSAYKGYVAGMQTPTTDTAVAQMETMAAELEQALAAARREPTAGEIDAGRRSFLVAAGALGAWFGLGSPSTASAKTTLPAVLRSQDLHKALEWVAANGSTPRAKALAAQLVRLVPKGTKLRLGKINQMGIARIDREAGSVEIDLRDADKYSGLTEETLLHESIHAAILARYDMLNFYAANPGKFGKRNADEAIQQYIAVWREFRGAFAKEAGAKDAPVWLSQPFSNPDEFITYALTSPEFQSWLQQREYKGKTLWQKFKESVARMLGFSKAPTWLDAALTVSDSVLAAAEKDPADFKVGKELLRHLSAKDLDTQLAHAADYLPAAFQRPAKITTTNLRMMAKKGVLMGAITQDLVDMAAKHLPSAHAYMKAQIERQATRLEHELRIENILRAFEKLPKGETGTGPKSANAFIYDSTFDGKWGYTPTGVEGAVVDPELEARFKQFSPEAQEVIRAVFDHGRQTMQLKQEAVRNQINAEFASAIAEAEGEAEIGKLERKKNLRLAHYESMLGVDNSKPYAPLKRYGEYAVVGKSLAYLEAEKNLNAAELLKLEQDENHYIVEFFDTQGEADAREADLFGRYAELSAGQRENADALNAGNRDMFLAFDRMRKAIDNELSETKVGTASLKKMKSMLRDMYLLSLSEASARKSELRRRNIHGASTDMMRALATQGRADAHFISTIKHDGDVQDSIQKMRDEVKKNRREAAPYLNELLVRHADSMQSAPHRVEDMIRRATSIWMLATSPAFYFQQMTQTYMMSVPVIASRFGYGTAMQAVTDAYFNGVFPLVGGNLDRLDFSKAPADVQDMLKELTRQGKIDIGIDVEMGEATMSARGHISRGWNAVDRTLRGLNVKVESVNRAAAAIAAYRLALAKNGGNKAEAIEYAGKVVHTSHGSYDGFNTPRLLTSAFPGARTVGQFRRFQIIQISMLARMWSDATKSQDPDTRAAGRAGLKCILAHSFAVGGLMGLPGFTAIAWLVGKLWPDDDEPDNPELTLRRMLGDGPMADMIVRGVPKMAGVDLSGKLGMGSTFSLMPFANLDSRTMSRQGYAETLAAAMGPFFGGLLPRAVDGVGQVMSGDLYKGMEQLLPSGVANAFKAVRFATEGVTMRKGDVVMPPEDVAFIDAVFQGLGLPTNTITDRQFVANAKRTYDDYYKSTESGLLRKYAVAYRSGDMAGIQQAREEWNRLQESRVRNGYSRQPLSTLLRAPQEMTKRENQTAGGVAFAKNTKRFVEDTAALVQ